MRNWTRHRDSRGSAGRSTARFRRALIGTLVLALVIATPSAAGGPLPIANATLTQVGQDLSWTVSLAAPFSPAGLAADHRTLCLLFERAGTGSVSGQACLGGAGSPVRPVLLFSHVTAGGPGAGTPIASTITRSGSTSLTATFALSAVGLGYVPLRWQVISTQSPPACVTAHATRAGCYLLFPAKPAALALHVPRVVGCTVSGPSEVFSGSPDRHEIALTFDDGPWPDPPAIDFVNLLAREHVPATFFEIGRQIPEFDSSGSAERAMLADGDMIGDHTWTHPNMTSLSPAAQTSELEQTADAIRKRSGFTPCLWRPPYGATDPQLIALARSLGMLTIMWDVDPRDWSLPGTAAIYQRVVSAAHNGAIVIQHFGGGPRYETLAALPREIATLRSEGYTFVTVSQLLGLKLIYR
jgi:peptidoglycan/xylan/chitin deacetylase (PgdA/CDA1 family)